GIAQVFEDDDVMLITDGGKVLRCPVNGISSMGRATQGVRVMNLSPDEKLVSIARVTEEDVAEGGGTTRRPDPAPRPLRAATGDDDADLDASESGDADLEAADPDVDFDGEADPDADPTADADDDGESDRE